MQRDGIISELSRILSGYLESRGAELVDLIHRYEGRGLVLRLIVDRPGGGITLDECAGINSDIGRILDEKGILEQRYILEVSSPGMDRPLINRNDFLRCLDKRARFFLNEAVEGKIEIEGAIKEVGADSLKLDKEGIIIEIPLAKINRAKQVIANF